MSFFRLTAVAASVFAMAACGGEKPANTDTTDVTSSATADVSSEAVAYAPITGTTHVVEMALDPASGEYKYLPETITIKSGDGIRYVNVSGGPHDVSFDAADVPADVRPQLAANMLESVAELRSPMMITPNEEYTVSFAKIKGGEYTVICTPHRMQGMIQKVTVEE